MNEREPVYPADKDLIWWKYVLPTGRKVFLTVRPDCFYNEKVVAFIHMQNVGIRFSFTDDPVFISDPLHEWPPHHWYLWVPGIGFPIENLFSFFCHMQRFIEGTTNEASVWLHCDSSSMRAPTFFGLFVDAFYPGKLKEIVDAAEGNSERLMSRPDEYAECEYKEGRSGEARALVDAWLRGGWVEARDWLLQTYGDKKEYLKNWMKLTAQDSLDIFHEIDGFNPKDLSERREIFMRAMKCGIEELKKEKAGAGL